MHPGLDLGVHELDSPIDGNGMGPTEMDQQKKEAIQVRMDIHPHASTVNTSRGDRRRRMPTREPSSLASRWQEGGGLEAAGLAARAEEGVSPAATAKRNGTSRGEPAASEVR